MPMTPRDGAGRPRIRCGFAAGAAVLLLPLLAACAGPGRSVLIETLADEAPPDPRRSAPAAKALEPPRPVPVPELDVVLEEEIWHWEQGTASYYGPKFHGRTTANGETFDMAAMTAAHPSLPFGTRVRVTNLSNGRSVVLRVNDRGPFIDGRIIDVSMAAAEVLDFITEGLVEVLIEALP